LPKRCCYGPAPRVCWRKRCHHCRIHRVSPRLVGGHARSRRISVLACPRRWMATNLASRSCITRTSKDAYPAKMPRMLTVLNRHVGDGNHLPALYTLSSAIPDRFELTCLTGVTNVKSCALLSLSYCHHGKSIEPQCGLCITTLRWPTTTRASRRSIDG